MKTLVLGATTNPDRYAYKAAISLLGKGHEIVLVGIKDGVIQENEILKGQPAIENVNTVTLYLGAKNQEGYYAYILDKIQPKRIIFNPGTENIVFQKLAQEKGIITIEACTLVMLSIGNYES